MSDSSDEDKQAVKDAEQKLKDTELFVAIRNRLSEDKICEEITKFLNNGANINAKNLKGKTVLDIAVQKRYEKVIQFLLKQNGIDTTTALVLQSHDESKVKFVDSKNTKADGNCFFHAVFGDNKSGQYEAVKAKQMRNEWHNFLKQFEPQGLKDPNMPQTLKEQLQKVFQFFLNNPQDLTNRSDAINRLVNQTQTDITTAKNKAEQLKSDIVQRFQDNEEFRNKIYQIISEVKGKAGKQALNIEELLNDRTKLINEISNDLEECALQFNPNLNHEIYKAQYSTQAIANSFLENPEIYKNYLEAIKQNSYYVFFEEIPILSSLANIKIQVHYNNNGRQTMLFEPNQELHGRYMLKPKIWGNKGEAIIDHEGEHFSHVNYSRPVSPHARSENQLIDSQGQQATLSKRKSTDIDEDGALKTKVGKFQSSNSNTVDTISSLGKNKLSDSNIIPPPKKSKEQQSEDTVVAFAGEDKKYSSLIGLKSSLHGNIYQLKLLMLFAHRGLEQVHTFRLATEMDAAEKFDDLVFRYITKDSQRKKKDIYRFLQAKHKQDEKTKITYNNLSTENIKGEFSLIKYFTSYRKIKQKPKFKDKIHQDFILCTNAGLDLANLQKEGIQFKKLENSDHDKFLQFKDEDMVKTSKEDPPTHYKLSLNNDQHELYEKLRNTSDLHMLVKALVKHIKDAKSITLHKDSIFTPYHIALVKETVIKVDDKKNEKGDITGYIGKFSQEFIKDINDQNNDSELSESAKTLKKVLQKYLNKEKKLLNDKKDLSQVELKVSSTFGKKFDPILDPQISNIDVFAKEIIRLIEESEDNFQNNYKIFTINGKTYNTNAQDLAKKVVANNIQKLAGHVLVRDEDDKELIRFRQSFFLKKDSSKLPGNLEQFRKELKEQLEDKNISYDSLDQYRIKATQNICKTCEENQLDFKPTLPYDLVHDTEITNFFKELVLAVNQPNEVELGKIIAQEIGEEFNLIDADLVSHNFQNHMLDWMKGKGVVKNQEGEYLDKEDIKAFFDKGKEKIAKLVIVGPTSVYSERIRELGVRFNKIQIQGKLIEFLSSDTDQIFNLVTKFTTKLGAVKVDQVLQSTGRYHKYDSYIFICLKSLLHIQKRVEQAYTAEESKLLIIECCQKEIYNKLPEIINIALSNTNKKIILITKDGDESDVDNFKEKFGNKFETLEDTSNFSDLTSKSQKNLLKHKVVFQGKETSFDTVSSLNSLIDSETLAELIEEKEIKIGSKLKDLGEINDYYIPRMFNRQVIFNKAKIKEGIESILDFFVISGTDSGLIGNINKIYVFDKNNHESAGNKFQELCEQNTGSNIHWLKSESGKLIWHQSEGSISNLVKYRDREIDKADSTDDKTSKAGLPEEKYLEENKSKIVIISDPAGMGKSTVLTSLSLQIKKANPGLWVIRIDLIDYTTVLKQELTNRLAKKKGFSNQDVNSVINWLLNTFLESQEQSQLTTKLEQELFKSNVNGQGKIALIFDGFDEISPDYQDVVIDILQALKKSKVEKLFVTARTNMRELLEERLVVFSDILEPFNHPNQIEFCTKFWTKKLKLKDLSQERKERLKTYAKSLIEKFSTSINDREQEFIGIPLQTMIIAEVFQQNKEGIPEEWEGCKEFLTADNINKDPKLPEKFDLLSLYEHFIKRKFYDFYLQQKKGRDFSKPGEKKSAEREYKNFKEMHETLALSGLFSDEDLKKLLSATETQQLHNWIQDINNVDSNEGIIDKIIDNKPHFIHRTFAEYFASFSLVKKMPLNSETICTAVDNLAANASPVFISSIAKILNKEKVRVESYTVLDFITRNKENYLKFFNALLEVDYQDDLGKTSLHYSVQHNYGETLEYVLNYKHVGLEKDILKHGSFKKPEYENSNLVKFVNKKDNKGKTALNYADNSNLDTMLSFKLLFKGANIDGCTQEYLKTLTDYMLSTESSHNFEDRNYIFDSNILGAYANQDNKFRPIQEKLLIAYPKIFPPLSKKDQSRLLSYFSIHGRVKVIHTLLRSINDEEDQKRLLNADDNGFTPFDRVNNSDQLSDDDRLEITKYLLENGTTAVMYDMYNNYITNILQAAANHGHIKTFQHFISQEDRDYYHLHFYKATQSQQFNIIKYLLKHHREKIAHDGNTPLHSAVDSGANLKIIKFLIDNGENVNAQNDKSETPLFHAIYKCKLNVIKYLVDHGADVNIADKQDYTVLYYAIKNDQRDTIKYLLLERKAKIQLTSELIRNKVEYFLNPKEFNLNLADKNGMPRLHRAIQSKDLEWTEFIIHNGGNVIIEDQEGKTPLHVASRFGKVEIVKLLFQYGAMYDKADKSHKKPIALSQNIEVSLILNTLDKLFGSQDLGYSLDDLYLERSIWHGWVHNDVWDSDNPMLFLLNARNHKGKSLLHIAANTNSLRALNNLLKFNHDNLEKKIESQRSTITRFIDYPSISIDAIDSQENTPLHLAAQKGHKQIVSRLLEEGAILNAENLQGKTPEELAKNNCHDNITKLLQPTKNLFIAIEQNTNNLEKVKSYINEGAYINAKDKNGKTPLHFASSSDQSDIVEFLLTNGANIEAIDVYNRTPLYFATENNKIEIVKLLLKNGVIFDAKDIQDKAPFDLDENQSVNLLNTIKKLFDNVQSDNPQVIIDNLEMVHNHYKVDTIINTRDNKGNTLLHYAVKSNEFNIVTFLLENGAIFDAQNKLKNTAKNFTSSQDIIDLLESIEKMFENVDNIYQDTVTTQIIINVRNDRGMTLLHEAAVSGKLDIVKWLVERGADVNAKDNTGNTVLHKAVIVRDFKIVKYLVKPKAESGGGADITIRSNQGDTALDIAKDLLDKYGKLLYFTKKEEEIVKHLQQASVEREN